MEPAFFLRRPQNLLSVMSWNVNGIRTKLEKDGVYNLLLNYDVIGLYEIILLCLYQSLGTYPILVVMLTTLTGETLLW